MKTPERNSSYPGAQLDGLGLNAAKLVGTPRRRLRPHLPRGTGKGENRKRDIVTYSTLAGGVGYPFRHAAYRPLPPSEVYATTS